MSAIMKTADEWISRYPGYEVVIVSGTANGVDKLGEEYARMRGYRIRRMPAQWNLYGKQAGPIRNRQMAEYAAEEKGLLLAFWNGKSRGTKNIISITKGMASMEQYITIIS